MNNLSWMLYFADVLANVRFFLLLLGAVGVAFWGSFSLYESETYSKSPTWWVGGVFCFSLFLACFMPSKDTMYAIAASEVGEQLLDKVSPTADKALTALNAWLDKQTK